MLPHVEFQNLRVRHWVKKTSSGWDIFKEVFWKPLSYPLAARRVGGSGVLGILPGLMQIGMPLGAYSLKASGSVHFPFCITPRSGRRRCTSHLYDSLLAAVMSCKKGVSAGVRVSSFVLSWHMSWVQLGNKGEFSKQRHYKTVSRREFNLSLNLCYKLFSV